MELTADNFLEAYMERELKAIPLKTMKGDNNVVYIRSLSTFEINQWRELGIRYSQRRSIAVFTNPTDDEKEVDALCVPELYLIRHCVCDSFGKLLFEDGDKFQKFIDRIPQELVNELVFHIELMNKFNADFKGKDELKKKLESSKTATLQD